MSQLVHSSPARHGGANRSQRARRDLAWRAPLRHARRAIRSTLARVETSGRVIDATARFSAGRPVETSRRLLRLGDWIGEASMYLQRAFAEVDKAAQAAEAAPVLLLQTAALWADAAIRLEQTTARIVETSARLVLEARSNGLQTFVPPQMPARVRCAPRRHAPVVLIRRHCWVITFAAEVAIEITRGRAPPIRSSAHSRQCSRV